MLIGWWIQFSQFPSLPAWFVLNLFWILSIKHSFKIVTVFRSFLVLITAVLGNQRIQQGSHQPGLHTKLRGWLHLDFSMVIYLSCVSVTIPGVWQGMPLIVLFFFFLTIFSTGRAHCIKSILWIQWSTLISRIWNIKLSSLRISVLFFEESIPLMDH